MAIRVPVHGGSCESEDVIASICARESGELIKKSGDQVRLALLADDGTFESIAEKFIPDQHEWSKSISIRTISLAAKLLLDEKKYREIAARNLRLGNERSCAKSGFGTNPEIVKKAMDATGLIAWGDGEDRLLEKLAKIILRPKGVNYAGQPDYERIAGILNDQFHQGEKVRNANGTRIEYWRLRNARKEKEDLLLQKRKEVPWSNEEENLVLLESMKTMLHPTNPSYRSGKGGSHPRPGTVNWGAISTFLNHRFHAEAWQNNECVRTPRTCLLAARRLSKSLRNKTGE